MADRVRAPRRGFLGSILAVLGAACLPWRTAHNRARWESPVAQPGGLARLEVCAPDAPSGALARVILVVSTPRETLRLEGGSLRLEGGLAQAEVTLAYPYEGPVVGSYSYEAEIHVGHMVLKTGKPVRYQVGAPSCFA